MASSASGQDEPNRALWLATRAGKMEPSFPLGTTRCIPHEKFSRKPYNKTFIDQVCSVKMVGYWPRSLFASLWTSTSSRSINMQKKELGQYQVILTSHLVNNPYVFLSTLTSTRCNCLLESLACEYTKIWTTPCITLVPRVFQNPRWRTHWRKYPRLPSDPFIEATLSIQALLLFFNHLIGHLFSFAIFSCYDRT